MSSLTILGLGCGWSLYRRPSSVLWGAPLSFAYPKIDLSRPLQTRLLHLLPSDENEPLRCDISVISLAEDCQYFALSYAWGPQSPDEDDFIQCSGQRLSISRTLNEFLQSYLQRNENTPLWIDALCIDQSNDAEKSYQIPNMGFIYSKATIVIIWLGTEDADTLRVLELLSEHKRANEAIQNHGTEPDKESCLAFVSDGLIASFDNPIWKALNRFYDRAWFKRVWTIQEEVLATTRIYQCGRYTFDNDLIAAGAPWLQAYQSDLFVPLNADVDPSAECESVVRLDWDVAASHFEQLRKQDETTTNIERSMADTPPRSQSNRAESKAQVSGSTEFKELPEGFMRVTKRVTFTPPVGQQMARRTIRIHDGVSLLTLLRISRTRQTSVDKDRVFALLGLADETNQKKHGEHVFQLSYALSTYETYHRTASFLIRHHKSLEVLKMVEYLPGYESEVSSWVPRWDAPEYAQSNILSEADDETHFTASGNIPLKVEESDDYSTVLAVHGQRLDRVVHVSSIISWRDLPYGDQFPSHRIYDIYADFQRNILSKFGVSSYPTGEPLRTVFAMTTIAGLDEHGRPADPDDFLKHFLSQYAVELEDDMPDKSFARRRRWIVGQRHLELDRLLNEIEGGSRARFLAAFQRAAEHRRIFLTAKGYLGLGPAAMKLDDHICILFGSNVPYIYRNREQEHLLSQGLIGPLSGQLVRDNIFGSLWDKEELGIELSAHDDYYLPLTKDKDGNENWNLSILCSTFPRNLIGHCYVHGMMHGEGVREFKEGKRESTLFRFR